LVVIPASGPLQENENALRKGQFLMVSSRALDGWCCVHWLRLLWLRI
jgi:hypothetical protein